MDRYTAALINHLSGFVSRKRLELFQQVLERRTRYITVLLEDIYQSQNASAVLRTCDCTGIQDVHVVEDRNQYVINPDVSLGSDRWLSVYYYRQGIQNLDDAVHYLRGNGYRIVAASPRKAGSTPETFDLERGKTAFMFGTELNGLTGRALQLADEFIRIPMEGFTESYNISVSAAVILYVTRKRLEGSSIEWKLTEEEKADLRLDWLRKSIRLSEKIEKRFREECRNSF